jgi:hypothetical protein
MGNISRFLRVLLVIGLIYSTLPLLTAVQRVPAGRAAAGAPQNNWWDDNWNYRVLVTANAAGYARLDKPAEVTLNFTQLLASLGIGGELDLDSLRVVEIDDGDNILDAAVPFQFDPAGNFNAATNARVSLTWILKGDTASDATRRYHVYFDVTGKGFSPAAVTPQISTSGSVLWSGFSSIRVSTPSGTYYYHRTGGGFASWVDADSHDWISWNPATGAAGDFRGIPNMVHPDDGGYFHPGRTSASTALLSQGPLKATFRSTNNVDPNNGEWQVVWEVFPRYARMTVTKAPAGKKYWLLYEGTPGGALNPTTDFLTRSDMTSILASGTWTTDIPDEEWVFASDPNVGRSLYLAHHIDDTFIDGYFAQNNSMTVFGFGRSGQSRFLTGTGRQLTIGLVDSTVYEAVQPVVYNAYKDLTIALGGAEYLAFPTPTPTATTVETATPTPDRYANLDRYSNPDRYGYPDGDPNGDTGGHRNTDGHAD